MLRICAVAKAVEGLLAPKPPSPALFGCRPNDTAAGTGDQPGSYPRSRLALATTVTELKAMAAPANIGESSSPSEG